MVLSSFIGILWGNKIDFNVNDFCKWKGNFSQNKNVGDFYIFQSEFLKILIFELSSKKKMFIQIDL